MIVGMQLTTKAETRPDTMEKFPRETYICGPSVVLGHGENDLFIFMSPTFEGCRDIHDLWTKDLQDTQIIIKPFIEARENFTNLRPGIDLVPETYDFLCVDVLGYDRVEESKLYAFDYYIYK